MAWAQETSVAKGDAKTDPWTSGAMGLASTSLAIRLGGYNHPAGPLRNDSIAFLEYCHSIGAAGVQTSVKGDLAKFRKRAEELGMFVEYESRLPEHADDDMSGFENSLKEANAVGASCLRVVSLSGRRYENFKTIGKSAPPQSSKRSCRSPRSRRLFWRWRITKIAPRMSLWHC
jgi:hypothetical protein